MPRSRCCLSRITLLAIVAGFAPAVLAQRLPAGVTPEHYTLSLTPDISHATFSGSEAIDVNLAAPTAAITLNAAEITFGKVYVLPRASDAKRLIDASDRDQLPAAGEARVSLDAANQQATLHLSRSMPAGKATIVVFYTGLLNNELRGFYLSKGPTRNYAVTQFEATDARRAFPSFDEPALKATFDLTLVVAKGDKVIANTNQIADVPMGDRHAVSFATTPRMSTYLVAFLVGDFECISGSSDGTPIRACATPDKVKYAGEALHAAEFFLHYYDTYFGIKYAMPKLDMIGIPDFEAGAMENWGAITYREADMLVDPRTGSLDAQKRVDEVVAHEMAHQWFGDLVTMRWWDNIWLNEGFATWMEDKAEAQYKPSWGMGDDVALDLDATLNLDAGKQTRTIRAQADTPAEINQMFDGITYEKGGAVIGMVEKYVGEDTFRKGVHDYLDAHKFSNASAEDFWGAQTRDSGKPVDKIMASFIAQPGVPLLSFAEPSGGRVSVTQSRFFLAPEGETTTGQRWTIPVCVSDHSNPVCSVLSPTDTNVAAPQGAAFFANANAHGYYRSLYSPATLAALVPQAESALSSEERILLLGDEWALMREGQGSMADFLNLVATLRNDPSADVLESLAGRPREVNTGKLQVLADKVASEEDRKRLAAWIRTEFVPVYRALPPVANGEAYELSERRAALFQLVGSLGQDPGVIAEAATIAGKWLQNPASVNPTLAQSALQVAAENGDAALFDKLQQLAETSSDPAVQSRSLRLLTQFRDPALEQRLLEYAVSGKVRNQDAYLLISTPLQTSATRELAWQFVQSHWTEVKALLTPLSGGRVVSAAGGFCSVEKKQEVDSFYATHQFSSSTRPLQNADNQITECIHLRAVQEPKLAEWLNGTAVAGQP